MKGKIAIVGKPYFTDGFLLAGIKDIFQTDERNEEEVLTKLLENKEYALIFITEGTNKRISWRLRKKIEESTYPLVIPLPNIKGEGAEEENLRAMIKRALGFDVMKK
jgi:vacuolar-type H+-ATPase subunit F/Vma7